MISCVPIYTKVEETLNNEIITLEGVWYMANIPTLRAVHKHDATRSAWTQPLAVVILARYHKEVLVTNVIKCFVIPVIYHGCQPISIQGTNHPE